MASSKRSRCHNAALVDTDINLPGGGKYKVCAKCGGNPNSEPPIESIDEKRDTPTDTAQTKPPLIVISNWQELVIAAVVIILGIIFVRAFIEASHDPSAYTTPDCQGGGEYCN